MLVFAVPAEPPAPPVLVAQVAQPTVQGVTSTQNSQTITFCRDKESLSPDSAVNDFSPISDEFLRQIGAKHGDTVEELKRYRVTLVTPPQHGQVKLVYEPSHHWAYLPTQNYEGTDRVIFLVESQGKRYKVVVNFLVAQIFDENRQSQVCDSIDFGTSNSPNTTVSGLTAVPMSDFDAWKREAQLSSLLNTVINIPIAIADLPGAAVGQTTSTTITLDTNAAGHNWFIDTTPWDNSEYLPTSKEFGVSSNIPTFNLPAWL